VDLLENLGSTGTVIRYVLDLTILTVLIYQSYKILVQTQAVQLIKGAFVVAAVYLVAFFFNLSTLLWIMNRLATVLVVIIAIVFQPELRNMFIRIGQGEWFSGQKISTPDQIESILTAVELLSDKSKGALIVFERKVGLKNIIESGTRLNADISSALINTVFAVNTPLHDGALVIQAGSIAAAGCFLPLSDQPEIKRSFGTRHRAALGLSETTDAVIIIVSEETGAVSLSYDSKLYYDLSLKAVRRTLNRLLEYSQEAEESMEEIEFER
jgi:diadenylate cyclase